MVVAGVILIVCAFAIIMPEFWSAFGLRLPSLPGPNTAFRWIVGLLVLAPLGFGPGDAQAALIQPLLYKQYSTMRTSSLQILTEQSKPILETSFSGHISGTFLDDSGLSRLKEAVERARPSAKESSGSELVYCTNCRGKIVRAKFCVHCGAPQVSL